MSFFSIKYRARLLDRAMQAPFGVKPTVPHESYTITSLMLPRGIWMEYIELPCCSRENELKFPNRNHGQRNYDGGRF